ncbi:ornithine decarboxylase antizyme 1-like [Planococcus citri]|uniref:ornithine decarboxylase antizyme 1-like n=1 Tax=Planococcus citri TaxID=170843 RepID=UPI0031F8DE45
MCSKMSNNFSSNSILISESFKNDAAFFRDVPDLLTPECFEQQVPHYYITLPAEDSGINGGLVLLSEKGENVNIEEIIRAGNRCAVQITFKLQITRDSEVTWESILFQQKLYIRIDASNPAISKMGFLGIMEYAEDVLKLLVRTFMYIGFAIIPPGHKLIPQASSDTCNIYMAYCIT